MSDSSRESAPAPASRGGVEANRLQDTRLLIDAKAAAEQLAIGSRTLWSLTKCNAIPSRRIGRAVRYCPAELRAWIDAGCPTASGSADRVRKEVTQ